MPRVSLRREVDVGAPAAEVWDYVTDWPRQQEWIPLTRVEAVDSANRLGGRIRAWTGLGRVGFWDPMTITSWERTDFGGGRCEVLHLGSVVKGIGEFVVLPIDDHTSRFVWAEVVVVPLGALGSVAWRVVRPLAERIVDRALAAMRDGVERESREGRAVRPR
jgi:Polyketide cyclase / dehydrase and lipid transport